MISLNNIYDQEYNIECARALPGPSRNDMTSNISTLYTLAITTHYNMNHSKRGRALIFFDEQSSVADYFSKYNLNENVDCVMLDNTLRHLGFNVCCYNSNDNNIIKILKEVANEDHSGNDCLMIVILYYGTCEYVCSREICEIERFCNHFTAGKCPTLFGKPKLFFIQICQFGEHVERVHLVEDNPNGLSDSFRIEADFLFVFTFIIDCPYWLVNRHTLFMENLCAQLTTNDTNCSLLTLLTLVCQLITKIVKLGFVKNCCLNKKERFPCINFYAYMLGTIYSKKISIIIGHLYHTDTHITGRYEFTLYSNQEIHIYSYLW
ncbi:caspase-1-like isoform X2 [Nylanderia fulva]|uniref:caspase-1-like isoform X2 n=1 Tax=Nylanderia fulva TaxID=613905 RepID=UPI0010FB5B1F|nr:caspase-1-like isoform X2 [Nylanderia fulva]